MCVIPLDTLVEVVNETQPINYQGLVAPVTGYEEYPPTCITRLILTRPGDVTFKYPRVYPWDVEVWEEN